ncbi:MAG: chromosomal replication initiator protein DnaA, partial [Desulfatibacillaceae bacterium]|nr:chromosomal replication initiator protein DnaA [Desulfatibacillaceae bacterium]
MLLDSVCSAWSTAKEMLRSQIPDSGYLMWIEPLKPLCLRDDSLVLQCPNDFSRKWLLEHHRDLLEKALQQAFRKPVTLALEVLQRSGNPEPTKLDSQHEPSHASNSRAPKQLHLPGLGGPRPVGRLLRRDFTFDRFVVGSCNDLAYSAALSLASRKSDTWLPLFVLSKTGLGKSHLSQAVGHHILHRDPSFRVLYVTAEDFTSEMVESLQGNTLNRFKDKYRACCDVLILEDVQFLSGKERTQKELSYVLDSLLESGKRLVFTSDHRPCEIPKLHDTVRSRLAQGLVATMETPDFKTRVRILKKKANGNQVPQEVLEMLASELVSNVRELESGLNGVLARSRLLGTPIDEALAMEVLKNLQVAGKQLTIGSIKQLICKFYRVTETDLLSKSRKQAIVLPRQVAMYLGRRYTDQSFQAIGRSFNRYHATALHAVNTVEKHIKAKNEIS